MANMSSKQQQLHEAMNVVESIVMQTIYPPTSETRRDEHVMVQGFVAKRDKKNRVTVDVKMRVHFTEKEF